MKKILEEANVRSSYKTTEKGVVPHIKNIPKTANKSAKRPIQNPSPGTAITKAPAAASRYIRKATQQEALEKSNHRCSYTGCNKPYDACHHPGRFAITKIQNPENPHKNIKPLCKNHHEFMHNGIVQNETEEPTKWQIRLIQPKQLNKIDQLYRQYKQAGGYA